MTLSPRWKDSSPPLKFGVEWIKILPHQLPAHGIPGRGLGHLEHHFLILKMGIIITTHECGCAPDGIRSRWRIMVLINITLCLKSIWLLNLWWFLTAAEQVSLFIFRGNRNIFWLIFLRTHEKTLDYFYPPSVWGWNAPAPISSLISTAFFCETVSFKDFLVFLTLLPTQPGIRQMYLNEGVREFRVRLFWPLGTPVWFYAFPSALCRKTVFHKGSDLGLRLPTWSEDRSDFRKEN